jgi:cobalt-zinc-cadmium efflux system membrane fusion protein
MYVDSSAEQGDKRDPSRLWCREHGVYEDQCVICHPELKDKLGKKEGKRLFCEEHRVPEDECGICHPELARDLKPGQSLKIRQISRRSALKAGIETQRPRAGESSAYLTVFCEVRYNQNHLVRITPLAPGVVHRVPVDVGQKVAQGDVLVEIASSEVAGAKRDYLVALVDEHVKTLAYEREKQLLAMEISAQQSYQQAEAEYEMARIVTTTARQKLLNYGFTEAEIKQVEDTRSSSSLISIRAPYAGTLVERAAVAGEVVEPGTRLFTLADLSTMWLELAVPESQIDWVSPGLAVEGTFSALPGVTVQGELVWVDSSVDERSRLVKARAVVTNPGVKLKNSMFGEVKVVLDGPARTLRVPSSALQRFERHTYVFVKLDDDLYDLRRVVVGEKDAQWVQILNGLQPDEQVVVTGGFTMKSEFLKSRLGAGCVDE